MREIDTQLIVMIMIMKIVTKTLKRGRTSNSLQTKSLGIASFEVNVS